MSNELVIPQVPHRTFEEPLVFLTLQGEESGNPRSVGVIRQIETISGTQARVVVCTDIEKARSLCGPRSVVLFDDEALHKRCFTTGLSATSNTPDWSRESQWLVRVGRKCGSANRQRSCAHQTVAHFQKRFRAEIDRGCFPWGMPKKGTDGPKEVIDIDLETIDQRINSLNEGPDLAAAIADRSFAMELPQGSKISWVRVLPEPIGFSKETIQATVDAMQAFEKASQALLRKDGDVRKTVLSGVSLCEERLGEVYLEPGVDSFSVSRPDLHWHPSGLSASENDEMPGGMPELVLLDHAYGMNEGKWREFFDFLTQDGPLLFLVSHEWSKCYVPETTWLVNHLKTKGYDARILLTDELHSLSVVEDGVYHEGSKLGTIWRQFPIFETQGRLADLVFKAREGKVKMFPEWAHFGNKAWFHLFWKYKSMFAQGIDQAQMSILEKVLPASRLVEDDTSFPFHIGTTHITSSSDLKTLGEAARNQLVLKIVGANNLSARSYGVLMGRGIKPDAWSDWINNRLTSREPFLVQQMFDTGIASLPVWHTKKAHSEMFRCRLLMRPWVLNGKIISVHGCAVPRECFKVHGMVSMAVTPVRLV